MERISAYTATDAAGLFTEGNGSTIPATEVDEKWLNDVQEELCGFIESRGIVLDAADRGQLIAAINDALSGAGMPSSYGLWAGDLDLLISNDTVAILGTNANSPLIGIADLGWCIILNTGSEQTQVVYGRSGKSAGKIWLRSTTSGEWATAWVEKTDGAVILDTPETLVLNSSAQNQWSTVASTTLATANARAVILKCILNNTGTVAGTKTMKLFLRKSASGLAADDTTLSYEEEEYQDGGSVGQMNRSSHLPPVNLDSSNSFDWYYEATNDDVGRTTTLLLVGYYK